MTSGLSLAERLGFSAEDRLLIVNCDDLGVSHAANLAIFRAMSEGIATSATMMVPCPWSWEASRLLAGFPIGVHLTLTSEYRGYRWRGLTRGATLHDKDGFLPRVASDGLSRLDAADARVECRAQIETALSWGVDVTHLDSHMNIMQDRSDLFEVYLDLAAQFRIPIRMFSEETTLKQGFQARERTIARGILFNDYMIYPWPRPARDVLVEEAPRLPPGITEIFAHPVLDGDELRGYDTYYPDLRACDAVGLIDPALPALLDRHGIRRISFRALRTLQRTG